MIKTVIEWKDPRVELPKSSKEKVLIHMGHSITSVFYSKKHKLFNASDCNTKQEAEFTAIHPLYWAEFPEFPENESEGE